MIDEFSKRLGANRVVMALSMARMSDALGNSILLIAIPLYVAQLHSPLLASIPESLVVGILISLYGLVFSALQPLTGAISDRSRWRKPFIIGGLAVMGLGILAFIFATNVVDLVAIRIVQGIGVAFTVSPALALMTISTEKETRGGSMGIYTAMRMVGFAIGPLLGGYLQVTFGFNVVFVTGAAFVFLAAALDQLLVQEKPTDVTKARSQPMRLLDPKVFTGPLIALGAAMFMMSGAFSMITTLEPQFNARLQETALGFGFAFSALTFTRLVFQIPLGRLSDRFGRKPLIIAGMIVMAPATALLGLVATTLQLSSLTAIQGLASAAVAAPAFALAGDLSLAGGEGRQMGLMAMGFGFGFAVGPLLSGVLAIYALELPFLLGGLLCLAGAVIVHQFVPETVLGKGSPAQPSRQPHSTV